MHLKNTTKESSTLRMKWLQFLAEQKLTPILNSERFAHRTATDEAFEFGE